MDEHPCCKGVKLRFATTKLIAEAYVPIIIF